MAKEILNNIIKWIKYILILGLFVILYIFFSWYGVIGYFIFIILIATKIIYSRWNDYKAITEYGANQLNKVFGGKKNVGKK